MDRYTVASFSPRPGAAAVWTCSRALTDPEQARRDYALINGVPLSTVYCAEPDPS